MAEREDIARELGSWLVGAVAEHAGIGALHTAFCEALTTWRMPLWRSTLGLELLHPEQSGQQLIWTAAGTTFMQSQRADNAIWSAYLNSPVKIVDDTGRPYRRRLDDSVPEMPLLEELRGNGATDYVVFPLPFLDTSRTATLSYATRAAGGFSDEQLAELEQAAALLSPYAERFVLRRLAIDLLDTYLGGRSGEAVFKGAVDRGGADILQAAILMADMRGFTRFSEAQPIAVVLATLNDFFDAFVGAIDAQDGEVLKFMGDGLLAIFPAPDARLGPACAAALAAARAGFAGLAALNEARALAGEPPLAAGLALHAGEIAWGNVGSRLRLDFTAIGPAVNHSSRLLELAKRLQIDAVVSGVVQSEGGAGLVSLGLHTLRDAGEAQPIFTLTDAHPRPL